MTTVGHTSFGFKFRKNLLEEAVNADNPPLPMSLSKAVEMTLCPKPEGSEFHKFGCVNRTCDNCGTPLSAFTRGKFWK